MKDLKYQSLVGSINRLVSELVNQSKGGAFFFEYTKYVIKN